MATVSARRVALDVLDRVLGQQQPFDDTFAGHPALGTLSLRDRAFARLLLTTTLRRLGQIDALLARFVATPPRSATIGNLLRLGAAQLLFLDTPAHAAVGETVALCAHRHRSVTGFANAVLRRIARDGKAVVQTQDPLRLNTPDWLWESWCAAYGARVTAIAAAHLAEPPLDLTVHRDVEEWARRLDATKVFDHTVRRAVGGPVEQLPGYAEGAWWVQDAAAALPVRLFGDLAGRQVTDLCAAPGGKTAQLCVKGARVTAVEISAKRAERLRQNVARLQLPAEVVVADALQWRPAAPQAAVLLDAPCTATGTIRRHPDIAWHKTPADVAKMAELQGRLLAAAVEMVEPGGLAVYASCSLQPEEGPQVIAAALKAGLPVERLPVARPELAGLQVDITPEGDVRTLPCHLAEQGGLDGFYIARLRKRSP
ncbi:MAG: RsmB/NOP family class I SAM-dependent RNA methyltransferase [Geminicoccaceae bacterium]